MGRRLAGAVRFRVPVPHRGLLLTSASRPRGRGWLLCAASGRGFGRSRTGFGCQLALGPAGKSRDSLESPFSFMPRRKGPSQGMVVARAGDSEAWCQPHAQSHACLFQGLPLACARDPCLPPTLQFPICLCLPGSAPSPSARAARCSVCRGAFGAGRDAGGRRHLSLRSVHLGAPHRQGRRPDPGTQPRKEVSTAPGPSARGPLSRRCFCRSREARWKLGPQLEAAPAPGTEQSQGLRISWACSPAAASAPAPRTCSAHPGNGGRGRLRPSQGVTQKLNRATDQAAERTSKAEPLGDAAISWRTLGPRAQADNSLKGSPS